MTIQVATGIFLSSGGDIGARQFVYEWMDFMRTTVGWTVPHASDGFSTTTDGSNITGIASLNEYVASTRRSYFVLRAPDGSRDILIYRVTTDESRWDWQQAALADGGLWTVAGNNFDLPTGPTLVRAGGNQTNFINETSNQRMHIVADDASPYSWACVSHGAGIPTNRWGAACEVHMATGTDPNDLDPFVSFHGSDYDQMWNNSTTFGVERPRGVFYGGSPGNSVVSALTLENVSGNVFPASGQKDSNGDDVSMPIPWGRRAADTPPNGFKGFSTFMQWNGPDRPIGETFNGKTRISFGVVNVPWDGVTVPVT
jgi:hypothetical protein